jgi:hypothetical protein
MTRRAALLLLIGQARLGILWLRVQLGRPLPAIVTALLVRLDTSARRLEQRGQR